MAQLTVNSPLTYEMPTERNNIPVAAGAVIFLGSAVGIVLASGLARQLVAGDVFVGFAEQHIDNTTGAAGAMTVPVMQYGRVQLAYAAAAITDIGKLVYASDGNTFTLTSTSNSRVGNVVRWISTGVVIVEFDATGLQRITQGA